MIYDDDAWKLYPQHRIWFDKLWLADQLKYRCGPCGVAPDRSDEYIVRPIYNLSGMGVGASIIYIDSGDVSKVPPGYFWCEVFRGKQVSFDYEFSHGNVGKWNPIAGWQAENSPEQLSRFTEWKRTDDAPQVPRLFNRLSDVRKINIEFVDGNPIEVHLRTSPDPDCDLVIPVWSDQEIDLDWYIANGYTYVKSPEDADGFLPIPRDGFLTKNHQQE